jgi:N-methylhydantoinase B/oxoprolinase/acetone carboxylase alpha subunit
MRRAMLTGGFNGTSVVQTHMTNSRLTDPEVLEFRFPVRLDSYEIRQGSGGAGRWRGGDGGVRRVRFLEPMTASILSNGRVHPAFGLAGGQPARRASTAWCAPTAASRRWPTSAAPRCCRAMCSRSTRPAAAAARFSAPSTPR